MKTRQGFVSNSSSSSFIVSVPKGSSGKVEVTIEVDLSDFSYARIASQKELDRHLVDRYGDVSSPNEYYLELYRKMSAAIQNGREVLCGSFQSDDGNPVETFLCNNGLELPTDREVQVIDNEAGY